jgi:hypothetical protein
MEREIVEHRQGCKPPRRGLDEHGKEMLTKRSG